VRHQVAAVAERLSPIRLGQGSVDLDEGASVLAEGVGLGRQLDRDLGAGALAHEPDDVFACFAHGSDQRLEGDRAADVEVGVVLPGVADAAVHLDVQLRAEREGRQRERARDGRREVGLRVVEVGACGAPGAAGGLLGGDEHVRAELLHRAEGADRAAELLALLRVLGRHLGAGASAARGLGGGEGPGQPLEALSRAPQQALRGNLGAVAGDGRDPAAGVDVLLRLERHTPLVRREERNVVARADHEEPGELGAEHQPGRAREAAARAEHQIPAEPDRAHERAIREPR
jgi:hypothetical protein